MPSCPASLTPLDVSASVPSLRQQLQAVIATSGLWEREEILIDEATYQERQLVRGSAEAERFPQFEGATVGRVVHYVVEYVADA
jgi:hypothetical protein